MDLLYKNLHPEMIPGTASGKAELSPIRKNTDMEDIADVQKPPRLEEIAESVKDKKYTERLRLFTLADKTIQEFMSRGGRAQFRMEDLYRVVLSIENAIPLRIGGSLSSDLLWSYLLNRTDLLVLENTILPFSFHFPSFFYSSVQDCANRVLIQAQGPVLPVLIFRENPIVMEGCGIRNPSILRAFLLRCSRAIQPSPDGLGLFLCTHEPAVLRNPLFPEPIKEFVFSCGLPSSGKPTSP